MTDLATAELWEERLRVVRAHVEAENERDLEGVMATFSRPRYEIVPTGTVFDGDAAVREMLVNQWAGLPHFNYAIEGLFQSADGLVVETRTIYPGGSRSMLSVNIFRFEGTQLVLERCYFDRMGFAEFLGDPP